MNRKVKIILIVGLVLVAGLVLTGLVAGGLVAAAAARYLPLVSTEPVSEGDVPQEADLPVVGPNLSDPASVEAVIMSSLINAADSDYAALQSVMAGSFSVCGYAAGCGERTPDEAVAFIRSILPAAGAVEFTPPGTDLPALLGIDPAVVAFDGAASAIHSSGWHDGRGEVLLYVIQQPDGSYGFASMTVAEGGFANAVRLSALLDFRNDLVVALMEHDYAALETMMDDGLEIIGDPEGPVPASAAVATLQSTYLLPTSTVSLVDEAGYNYILGAWDRSYRDVLGYEVTTCCEGDVEVVYAVRIDGWGPDGDEQAMAIIVDKAAGGGFSWYGVIPGPFASAGP
jgi:hypothetical protein